MRKIDEVKDRILEHACDQFQEIHQELIICQCNFLQHPHIDHTKFTILNSIDREEINTFIENIGTSKKRWCFCDRKNEVFPFFILEKKLNNSFLKKSQMESSIYTDLVGKLENTRAVKVLFIQINLKS